MVLGIVHGLYKHAFFARLCHMSGTLYIVATPIGNLSDITERAKETLASVDTILCEDTRVTKKLLSHFGIATPTMSYHQHSNEKKYAEILSLLEDGKQLALVTDAGTPGISDPGNRLIQTVIARNEERVTSQSHDQQRDSDVASAPRNDSVGVVPVPGASAVTTALSISGFPTDKFLFLGFPSHKNKRKKFFEELAVCTYTAAFYESTHRIAKAIADMQAALHPDQEIVVCRELTKKFETTYRGTVRELSDMPIKPKGEFVIIVRAK